MKKSIAAIVVMSLFVVLPVQGATIDASNGGGIYTVSPNEVFQAQIMVSAEVGDPDSSAAQLELLITGIGTLPVISALDLLSAGHVYTGGWQLGPLGIGSSNAWDGSFLQAGSVTATGPLATATIDTTGVAPGIYTLSMPLTGAGDILGGTLLSDASGAPMDITSLTPGVINIIPEPATLLMFAMGVLGLAVWTWRRKTR